MILFSHNMNMNMNIATEEKQLAQGMAREIHATQRDTNTVLTLGEIAPIFQNHFADLATGESGIADLICRILTEKGAILPARIESSELRKTAIASSLFTQEIIDEVAARFSAGSTRYPVQTIKATLGVTLAKEQKKIVKIQLTNAEDSARNCCRPRCKWYIVQTV